MQTPQLSTRNYHEFTNGCEIEDPNTNLNDKMKDAGKYTPWRSSGNNFIVKAARSTESFLRFGRTNSKRGKCNPFQKEGRLQVFANMFGKKSSENLFSKSNKLISYFESDDRIITTLLKLNYKDKHKQYTPLQTI